jgi:hypothetical protein
VLGQLLAAKQEFTALPFLSWLADREAAAEGQEQLVGSRMGQG